MVGREREKERGRQRERERGRRGGVGGGEVVRQLISFWPNSCNLSEHSP